MLNLAMIQIRSMKTVKTDLKKQDKHRVKKAATLLQMGKPQHALAKLQRLTRRAWNHPLSERVLWRAAVSLG